jgi:transketolase C-terminal domain/subunit
MNSVTFVGQNIKTVKKTVGQTQGSDGDFKQILGAFAKLRKVTVSFIVSVGLSVYLEQHGSHWMNFREILYFNIFRKSVDKIQVSLKSDKTDEYFT